MKKLFSIIMSLLMVVCFMPTVAFANETGATIYVSQSGNDSSYGTSAENPVKTLSKAYEKIGSNGTICLLSDIDQDSTTVDMSQDKNVTITSYGNKKYSIIRGSGNTNTMFNVTMGTLTLENITLDGKKIQVSEAGKGYAILINGATAIVNLQKGTTIQNIYSYQSTGDFPSGTVRLADGTLNMHDGAKICNNKGYDAPGVIIRAVSGSGTTGGEFNMYGGEIVNNYATGYTGGLYIAKNSAVVNMIDGKISNNYSSNGGGGGVKLYETNCQFNMTGGEITGNGAGASNVSDAAGISVNNGTFTIGGDAKVKDNYVGASFNETDWTMTMGETASDIYISDSKLLSISQKQGKQLTSGACIGVYTATEPNDTTDIKFATGAKSGDEKYFFSDKQTTAGVVYCDGSIDNVTGAHHGEHSAGTLWLSTAAKGYSVDLGTLPTVINSTGGNLCQTGIGVGNTNFSSIALCADSTKNYAPLTEQQASAINTALSGTGLSASLNNEKKITISGTPRRNVYIDLSAILTGAYAPKLGEAKIGDTVYATLGDALKAANGEKQNDTINIIGDTVTAVNDATLGNNNTLKDRNGNEYKAGAENTKVSVANDGAVTLTSGKLEVTDAVKATINDKEYSFSADTGKSYTVDTASKKLTLNTDGSVQMGIGSAEDAKKVTFVGNANSSFELGENNSNTTATIPDGASVTGTGATIKGVGEGEGEANKTKVEIDSTTGALTLIAGKGEVTGNATLKVAVQGQGTSGVKLVDVEIPTDKTYTIDADQTPPVVRTLKAGDTIRLGGITYTAGAETTKFPIGEDKLVNAGDKAEVPKETEATITLGTNTDAPKISVPNNNQGATTITKGNNGNPTTVELAQSGDTFTVGGQTYKAARANSTFTVADEGGVALSGGAATVAEGETLSVVTGGENVPVVNNGEGDITVEAKEAGGKSSVTVPNNGSVTIGSGDNERTYPSKANDTKFVFDKDGNVALAAGKTGLSDGNSITGTSGKLISNPAGSDDDEIEVTAGSPENNQDTVTVPKNGKVNIGDTEYDAGEEGATIIASADSNKLSEGSVKLDKDETINVGDNNTSVKNTGDKQIEVSSEGKVTVPAGGMLDIGTAPNVAKITDVTKDTTFNIDGNGKIKVDLPKDGSVTINGVTYTDDGSGEGKLTIDENGKVTGATNVKVEISEDALAKDDFEYGLIPGVPVTIGKYTYTAPAAPKQGKVGDVTIKGRTDTKGKALNPAVVLNSKDGTVDVSLKDTPATKTTYTAANANTMFAMAASDTDTTRINLLDNENENANSALKFTDKAGHTVNGVTYQAQTVKNATTGEEKPVAYTVTYGTKTETVTKDDGDTEIKTNCNTVSVESGSKVVATMNAKAAINIGSGKVGDDKFETPIPFNAGNSGASIIIDNSVGGDAPTISGNGSYLTPIKDKDGNVTGYEVTRYYSGGYVPTQTTDKENGKTDEEIKAEQDAKAAALTGKIQIKARSIKTKKGNIKVTVKITKGANSFKALEDMGYTLKYRFYRSTKKSASYKAKFENYKKPYTNTDAKKGVRYYYKARVLVYDAQCKLIAKTKLGKCWYATRIR